MSSITDSGIVVSAVSERSDESAFIEDIDENELRRFEHLLEFDFPGGEEIREAFQAVGGEVLVPVHHLFNPGQIVHTVEELISVCAIGVALGHQRLTQLLGDHGYEIPRVSLDAISSNVLRDITTDRGWSLNWAIFRAYDDYNSSGFVDQRLLEQFIEFFAPDDCRRIGSVLLILGVRGDRLLAPFIDFAVNDIDVRPVYHGVFRPYDYDDDDRDDYLRPRFE